jgi:biopolymer transport protein ExbD
MSKLGRHRATTEQQTDIDMVPVMNMFLVLIPFLLMSVSFFHIKAINTSVPVLAQGKDAGHEQIHEKVTAIVEIEPAGFHVSAISDSVGPEELDKWDTHMAREDEAGYPLDQLVAGLKKMKVRYPTSDTLIIIPDESIIYDTIIQAMDVARYYKNDSLFPKVVLSGKVG